MALPTYDKTKRRKTFAQLPKGAYVIKIMNAKEDKWPSGDACVKIAFDIAEGEYAGFYQKIFDGSTNEDRKWPFDAVYTLNVPTDNSKSYVWDNWNSFFADLEDSNAGFVFGGDLKQLKGKLIGGLFRIKQTEYNGNVYDHTELYWTRTADNVRSGNYGRLPKDKLVEERAGATPKPDASGFMDIPDGDDEELPF